jgi:hypothetical protein
LAKEIDILMSCRSTGELHGVGMPGVEKARHTVFAPQSEFSRKERERGWFFQISFVGYGQLYLLQIISES